MSEKRPPYCWACMHFHPTKKTADNQSTCPAFDPKPIPKDILNGRDRHLTPHPKQRSDRAEYVFMPLPEDIMQFRYGPREFTLDTWYSDVKPKK